MEREWEHRTAKKSDLGAQTHIMVYKILQEWKAKSKTKTAKRFPQPAALGKKKSRHFESVKVTRVYQVEKIFLAHSAQHPGNFKGHKVP